MEQELVKNDITGEFEMQPTSAILTPSKPVSKRIWTRNARQHDASFLDEGATIFLKFPSKEKLAEIELIQERLMQQATELQAKGALSDEEAFGKTEEEKKALLNAKFAAMSVEEQKTLTAASEQSSVDQLEFAYMIVCLCVTGWEDAPIPYAPEAIDELTAETLNLWMPKIQERLSLNKVEARFLQMRSRLS